MTALYYSGNYQLFTGTENHQSGCLSRTVLRNLTEQLLCSTFLNIQISFLHNLIPDIVRNSTEFFQQFDNSRSSALASPSALPSDRSQPWSPAHRKLQNVQTA